MNYWSGNVSLYLDDPPTGPHTYQRSCEFQQPNNFKALTFQVYGSVFITTIIFSPIFGKFINSIGSRNLFLYGTFLAGSTTALFGFLEFVNGSTAFFVLSLSIRVVSAIGESAFFCAIYPLATSVSLELIKIGKILAFADLGNVHRLKTRFCLMKQIIWMGLTKDV